ncbi:hypothetical protein [Mesobacillus maritimus]|uniref:hypothetical protein n=1 Tax=Mesobacillus maritimus TaxID=1643336 RepID=UPI00384F87FF
MKEKRIFPRSYLTKLSVFGTVVAMASAFILNGCSTSESVSAKENNNENKNQNKKVENLNGESKSNVVFIVLDDSGFSDLGVMVQKSKRLT